MNTLDTWKQDINARIVSSTCVSLTETLDLIMKTLITAENTVRELRKESDELMAIIKAHSDNIKDALSKRED